MKKKLLIPMGAIIIILTLAISMNKSIFKMGMDYINYRYFSQDRAAGDFSEIQENPFEKYLEENEVDLEEAKSPPDGSSEPAPAEKRTEEIEQYNSSNDNIPSSPVNNPTPSTNPTEVSVSKPTLAQISREYMLEFEGMEANFRKNLEGLVGEAVEDYNSGQYSKNTLADMYLQKGERMEVESDEKFYRLLGRLEQKLIQHSFNTNMVGEVESYYIKLKKYEKNRMIDKGMALLDD
ncbi:MAG: hypothetical protein NUK57_02845 [Gudongella sp.]|nr:hypothetical protein [Gudongella sp.]